MRITLSLTRGIAGLALSAFVFMGCQDFLSEDKPEPTAKTPAEEVQVAAQEASAQEASPQVSANTELAKDVPVTAAEPPKPVTSEPVATPSNPTTPDNTAECKDIYAQMQTAKDPLYGELKNKFSSLNCGFSNVSVPIVPPDSATICNNLRSSLAQMDPNSTKYPLYQADIAIYCVDAKSPADPVATPTTPTSQENVTECQAIYEQLQTAKDPLYGELKNKFGSLNCDISKISVPVVPFVPPDSATICKSLRSSLEYMDPSSPKYASYQESIAIYCAAKP